MSILGLSRWNKNWNVRNSYSYVATANKIRFHFQFPRSPDAEFGGLIGWLFNWKCKFSCRIISKIANYLKYNYFWDGDGIENVTSRLWKFSYFCSRHMNIEENFETSLWRHRWRHHHENVFGIIWDGLFISDVKWKLCLIFQNFQNGRHFEFTTNFFYWKLYRKLNIPERKPWTFRTFWAFDRRSSSNIDLDISI